MEVWENIARHWARLRKKSSENHREMKSDIRKRPVEKGRKFSFPITITGTALSCKSPDGWNERINPPKNLLTVIAPQCSAVIFSE